MKQFPSKAFGVFFLLFCISFLFLHCHSLHHPLHHECSAETFDPNSTFQNNLGQLVNSLTNFGPVKGLLKIRVGEFPEKVYGLFQCRGDVTTESCSDCFQTSIDYIQGSCVSNLSITGIVWYEICLLRYSDEDFYGVADTHGFLMYNSLNVSEPESGSIDEDALITSLVARATSTSSKFLATDMPVASETRYGLVQCTGDLTIYNCSRCWYALMYKLKNCCYGKKSWRYLALSCSIWYDSEKFYGVPGSLELAPQQMPIAPRSSNTGQLVSLLAPAPKSTPTNISQGKTGSSLKAGHRLLWQVGVGVLVVIVLILVLVWCCISRWRKPQGVAGISGGDGENKVKTQELQLVDIATLRAATDNFSNANKLGEGGFGVVYKVGEVLYFSFV